LTSENIISSDAEECGKTIRLIIKSVSLPKYELFKPSWILGKEYQKSRLDLVVKEKSLNCQNIFYPSSNYPADRQAQDRENVGYICY